MLGSKEIARSFDKWFLDNVITRILWALEDWGLGYKHLLLCELASSPSCGSQFLGLSGTGGIFSRCFDSLLFSMATWLLISSGWTSVPRWPEYLCLLWLSPFTIDLEVTYLGCADTRYLWLVLHRQAWIIGFFCSTEIRRLDLCWVL